MGERECIKKAFKNIMFWSTLAVHSFFAYFLLVWVQRCPHFASTYLFVLIYSKVLQPWCLSGVFLNLYFFKTAKKQQIKKHKKREEKRKKKEKRELKGFFGGILILKLSDRD